MDLGTGLLGMSVLGDLGGAISSWFQQQRLRDAYKKQIENYQRATSPEAITAGMKAYADPIYAQYSPQVARQAAGALGAGGVADGGYGNALMQQALAGYLANLQQQGAQNYMQGVGLGSNALQGASGAVGPGFGSSGASMDALKTMMMLQALRGGGGGAQQQSGMATAPASSSGGSSASFGSYPGWGGNLDLGVQPLKTDPYLSDPFGANFSFSGANP